MEGAAGRLLDRHGDLGPRATARGIALCDQGVVHAALTIEPCELEHCAACAAATGAA
jgi:hypothetical protein